MSDTHRRTDRYTVEHATHTPKGGEPRDIYRIVDTDTDEGVCIRLDRQQALTACERINSYATQREDEASR